MTRQEAKALLITLGIEEPNDEQVTNYLNSVNKETQKEKEKSEKFKADSEKMKELQAQLDELNNANLSELEKANKSREDALSQVAKLEKDIANMKLKASMAEIGITGENFEGLFKDGAVDVGFLGKIISEREASVKAATIKEIADNAEAQGASGGNGAEGDDKDKPLDVANAEKINFGTPADTEARDAYVLH